MFLCNRDKYLNKNSVLLILIIWITINLSSSCGAISGFNCANTSTNSSEPASKLENILLYSSNVYKYDDGYAGSSNKFLGSSLL